MMMRRRVSIKEVLSSFVFIGIVQKTNAKKVAAKQACSYYQKISILVELTTLYPV